MATVGIDCRFGSALAGLGTFTRSLTKALLERSDPWSTVLFVKSKREEWLAALPSSKATIIEAPFSHYSFGEQSGFPNLIQDSECDLLLVPHFNVPLLSPVPVVCTVHDLILHRFPNEASFPKRMAYRFLMSRALRGARRVLTVSKATLADIRSHYGASVAEKTVVAYPGVDPSFTYRSEKEQNEACVRYDLHKPFFLYVGNCKTHKNVGMLMDAFTDAGLPGVELVIVAGGRECAHLSRRPGVRFLPLVPPSDLPALYSAAIATVTATLLEGFCLPLIEAMACRCPVIATKTGPIPEVCGDHALLTEPRTRAISDALRRMVQDPSLSTAAKRDAAERFSHVYSWEHTAGVVAQVLKEQLA